MNRIPVRKGDGLLIPPAQVHAASGHLKILEISECSELFFRVHDWGRGENELHLEEAFDLVALTAFTPEIRRGKVLADCPQFRVSGIDGSKALHVSSEGDGGFVIYYCASGEAAVVSEGEEGTGVRLKPGELVLVPSDVDVFDLIPSTPDSLLLEVDLPPRKETDPYIED